MPFCRSSNLAPISIFPFRPSAPVPRSSRRSLKVGLFEPAFGYKPLAAEGNESLPIPDWKASIGCFLLVAGASPLQIAVNIGPKLLQLIPEGVDAHLNGKAGETRRKTTI